MAWTLERIAPRTANTMLSTIGFTATHIEEGRCVAGFELRPELLQPLGLVHGGAIVALADTTATYAALTVSDPDATFAPERFPLAVQISTNLLRNTGSGSLTAEARVTHAGRLMQVVTTEVRDERARLLAIVMSTHVVAPRRTEP